MKETSWLLEEHNFDEKELLKNESLYHIANGYIGMRGNFEEGYKQGMKSIRGTYMNGFYDVGRFHYAEKFIGFPDEYQKMVNIIDVQGIELWIDKERFSMFEGMILDYYRALNMKKGYSVRRVIWRSPKGHELEITIKRMASFVMKEMITIEYEVTSLNYEGEICLKSLQNGNVRNFSDATDPRLPHESSQNIFVDKIDIRDNICLMNAHTRASNLHLASGVYHYINKESFRLSYEINTDMTITSCSGSIQIGETINMTKYAIFTDSRRNEDCFQTAYELIHSVKQVEIIDWYKKQENYLDVFWNNVSLIIKGAEPVTIGIRFNMYGLLQSVGRDKYSNVAAKGLSGEGYEGHYFWDTEIYIFPFFLLTQVDLARNLLAYRYHILDEAREHARLLGHKQGALYPWRTITGSECSSYFLSGSAQYHINGDIAYTMVQYYLATLDLSFMEAMGAEVLFEVARLWMDTGHFDNGSFKIHEVTGPDEYTCLVDNNYYTNSIAKYSLYWANKMYELLQNDNKTERLKKKLDIKEYEVKEWKKASDAMYLPVCEMESKEMPGNYIKLNPQDDTFLHKKPWDFENTPDDKYPLLLHYHPLYIYRHQVLKQADTVLAYYLTEDYHDLNVMKNSFEYYEKLTTHDSSLSTCIYSIVAARLNQVDKAYQYFIHSARFDLEDYCNNTQYGIHTANMGGSYMAMVYGFGGLRIKEDGLYFRPTLPKQFEAFEFNMSFRNRKLKVQIQENLMHIEIVEGEPLIIHVNDKVYDIDKKQSILIS